MTRIVYGVDTKSIEDLGQVVVVDVPEEWMDDEQDTEDYLDTMIGADDMIWVVDLLNERKWAKWHFESQDEGELSSCPACKAEWESHGSSMSLTHEENCGYVTWRNAVAAY